ncbi:hypothetical protein K5P26_05210 [Sphingopyxis sp. XHP0097]|jgi:hypothetical protein|uniref:Uncharacterized protein n=1 Tax=Sphingopyxis jiangsuensis TaxID=2871171 RepID=A0ABS7MBY8_9SPHN|nr:MULTISPECIES: hypothetical protein [Sphingopyxis]MBY4636537.1 hypothetical protein [Sphingopyxis jiangsuensis]
MGVELHRDRGVPIGLIDASWGGYFIEAWLDPVVLERTSRFDTDLALTWARQIGPIFVRISRLGLADASQKIRGMKKSRFSE